MRFKVLILTCLLCLVGFTTGRLGSVDIRYDFESIDVASGPDTFELFESATSDVSLSSQYAFRGSRSLHIQDFLENRSFPEFQGYFPTINAGTVEIGFALMTPDPLEPFNVAIAGKQHFQMIKDGLGFWLINDKGTLRHMSDSIPKRLFELTAYQWYWFALELDLSNGEYSIQVNDESGQQLVQLEKQKQPTNSKRSSIYKYSFIGDIEDRGSANLYIDEFVLTTDYADSPKPLIAPGRRTLFVDRWNQYHKNLQDFNFCLPPKLPYDFIDSYNTDGLKTLQNNIESLKLLLSSPTQKTLTDFSHQDQLISGIARWSQGCLDLKNKHYKKALTNLEAARRMIGNSPATQLSLALAYAKTNQNFGAKSLISRGQLKWPDDIRWSVLSASVAFTTGQSENSEEALRGLANSLELNSSLTKILIEDIGWIKRPAAKILEREDVWNEQTEDFIVAEQYYYSLLWQSQYRQAKDYADDFNKLLGRYAIESPLWYERAGDAAFFSMSLNSAEREYQKALKLQPYRMSSLLKIADVYFLQGRVEDERRLRESIYGALNYE